MLIVDDEEAILFALEDFLTAAGWRVATAASPTRVEELLAASCAAGGRVAGGSVAAGIPFAAAIVDLRLSPSDDDGAGLEVIRRIRELSPGTRIVLLTAYGSPLVEAEARRLGVDSLLAKPQPLPELHRHLEALVARPASPAAD